MKLLRCATIHCLAIDDYPTSRQSPDEYILRNRKVGQQSHFLVDQNDTGIDCVTRASRSIGSPFPMHRAGIGLNQTSDDRRKRGLSGSVFTKQSDKLAWIDIEINACKDLIARKALADTADR